VFTSALRSNVRDADLIENSFSVEICLMKPLLSNSLHKYATIYKELLLGHKDFVIYVRAEVEEGQGSMYVCMCVRACMERASQPGITI
jgi:hypothetical protein